jgi:tetratricopeptide (TPR) repeat protein
LDQFSHIDLLHIARRIWKYDLDSKKLSDIETNILQFTRGDEEIPGWLVPQMYQDYVQTGNAEPLQGVFYHNEIDVVSLAALFLKIEKMLSSENLLGNETLSLGEIFHKARRFETADEFYKKALENNSGSYFREKALINLAYSLKQQEKLEEMCTIWKELAQAENLSACIELAKFYEHKEKNYISALEWTEKAIRISENPSANASSLLAELENRRVRLVIKLGNAD